jgi:hypothetical protein
MLQLSWIKSEADGWLNFQGFNLPTAFGVGVYVVWYNGHPGRVVRVGQGDIKLRIGAHRNDSEITQYAKHGALLVTWAIVGQRQADGIERYMGDNWHPLVGTAFPDVAPIAVNTPW